MGFQNIFPGLEIPPAPMKNGTTAPSKPATLLIDAANEKAGFIIAAPKSGNVRTVYWCTATVTTGATLDIRVETIDATTGNPSGSLWSANTNISQAVANGDDNTTFGLNLTADAAVVKGDLLAIVISNPGASFGNMQIGCLSGSGDNKELPYSLLFASGSWTKQAVAPMIALAYDDGTVVPIYGCWCPCDTITTHTFNTGSTPDSIGALITLPVAYRVGGCWLVADGDGDFVVKLVSTAYNQGAGTGILAQSNTIDKDVHQTTSTPGLFKIQFTSSVELLPNTNYRLVVEPTSGTSLSIYSQDLNGTLFLDAVVKPNWCLTTAKDPTGNASWTNYNNVTDGAKAFPWIGLLIDGLDLPSVNQSKVIQNIGTY